MMYRSHRGGRSNIGALAHALAGATAEAREHRTALDAWDEAEPGPLKPSPPYRPGCEATSADVVENLTTGEVGIVLCGTQDGRLAICRRAGEPAYARWERWNVRITGKC